MSFFSEIANEFSNQNSAFWTYTKDSLKHPALKNVYYAVFLAYFFCFFLEVVLPRQRKHGVMTRKNFWLDIFYILFNDILLNVLGFFALCAVTEFVFLKFMLLFDIHTLKIIDITHINPIFQILILFVLQDFCEYVAHIILHRSNFLWEFHKIHHAQEELGAASTRHFHWVEMIIFKPLIYIPFALIGYSAVDYFLFQITVQNVWGFFTHCNIKVKWGWLNYIFNTPETHAWHHAKNIDKKYGVNFASILNIWDLLFGYYYLPKDKQPVLGVAGGKEVPETFLGQFFYPFKKVFSKKK
ncbi:MAG: sterol desaturase family protein [Bacteroidota bacterium]|nr:sterol desaturase family protein [Bacteroidota bacterium]